MAWSLTVDSYPLPIPTAPQCEAALMMGVSAHGFVEGDRVAAVSRPGFPRGTVLKLMDGGLLLVKWDGDVLETAHPQDLTKEPASAACSAPEGGR